MRVDNKHAGAGVDVALDHILEQGCFAGAGGAEDGDRELPVLRTDRIFYPELLPFIGLIDDSQWERLLFHTQQVTNGTQQRLRKERRNGYKRFFTLGKLFQAASFFAKLGCQY